MTQETINPCPEPVTCSLAVEIANLRGEILALTQNVRALKASADAAFGRGERTMEMHGGRIEKLEKKVWWATGAASAISGAFAAIAAKFFGGGAN